MKIFLNEVTVKEGRRKIDDSKVKELAGSIKELGLLNPITVCKKNLSKPDFDDCEGKDHRKEKIRNWREAKSMTGYELIAGAHRIAAYKLLGKTEIEANVISATGVKVKLAEIDENLIRNELHPLDRGELLNERKEIYEKLYPETKQGIAGGKAINKTTSADSALVKKSFVNDTASKTGISKRKIFEEVQLAKRIIPEVKKQVKELDLPKTDMIELARIEPEKQKAVIAKIKTGEASNVKAASKKITQAEKATKKSYTPPTELPKDCKLYVADIGHFAKVLPEESVDFVITDPPYNKESVHLYNGLSTLARFVLKPGGSLVVMCGQSYLPEVINELCRNMTYHWCMAYLTPGGQSPQLWQKKTNTFWKPVLWFVKGKYNGDTIGDVLKSPPNDNDKQYHEWGQSLNGFREIVEKFTYPGQVIYDPFLGGGTTGVAAVTMGRKFIGSDIEPKNIEISRKRILEAICKK